MNVHNKLECLSCGVDIGNKKITSRVNAIKITGLIIYSHNQLQCLSLENLYSLV
jgi:hypothetical protein